MFTAKSYERTAKECVRLAAFSRDPTLKRGLNHVRRISLEIARRLRAQAMTSRGVPQQSNALAKQLLKLRWMGMEEDAYELQLAMRSLPPEQRGTVFEGPFSTD